jgi:predicted nucleotidyltransferase
MIELFDLDVLKVFSVFSLSPGSRLKRKLIKEKTFIPNVILDKTLAELINYKFLKLEKEGYSLNFENKKINEIIKLVSEQHSRFKQLPLREYFIILHIKEELSKIWGIGDVYLFGSYAKLIFTDKSDIDIAIISNEDIKNQVKATAEKLEKRFKKRIEIHFFGSNLYNNKRDLLVKEILQHGVKMI